MNKTLLFWIAALTLISAVPAYFLYSRGDPIIRNTWSGPVKECAYPDANREMQISQDCGTIDENGTLQIEKTLLKLLSFDSSKLACIMTPVGRAFYVDEKGRTSEAYFFDSGCDYFSEGLARSPSAQGMRFINTELNVVISTPYQFALPFENGFAVVCNDLRYRRTNDEYGEYVGGQCGFIDKKGILNIPMRYSFDEIYSHQPQIK